MTNIFIYFFLFLLSTVLNEKSLHKWNSLTVAQDHLVSNFALSDIFPDCNDSEQTRVLLTSAAYVHLKHAEASKYTRNLSPASRTILLSGPAGWLSGVCILLGL
jgi:hypothetical protein